jgi:ribose 1,5-bisphosphate isomerase
MPIVDHERPNVPSRPPLPTEAEAIVQSFESGAVLGASRTIRLINEVFCLQVAASAAREGAALAAEVRQAADYFVATRGALSPAVGNAIRCTLRGLEATGAHATVDEVRQFVVQRTADYNRLSLEHVRRIAQYGANLLAAGDRIIAYDYSSTVEAVLQQAAQDGKRLHVVVPESRFLNGGQPILRDVIEWGHTATFTVDMALGPELRRARSMWVGVESLTATGGFWTTIGTRTAAILAQHYQVPFYVPTELIKIDPRSAQGFQREVRREPIQVFQDLDPVLAHASVSVECDDLEYTPRELITAFVTEVGVLPPEAVWVAARGYVEQAEAAR